MANKNNNSQIVPEDDNSSFVNGNGNFSPPPDDNNPLFAKKKNRKPNDALVQQMNQLLPGVLPQDEGPSIEVSAEKHGTDEDGKPLEPLSDMDVIAILNVRSTRAREFIRDEISIRAMQSIEDYFAQPHGDYQRPDSPGRSHWVDSSVADTVNWLLPPLLDVFCGTDDVVNFTPRSAAQERSAEMTTAMVNHVWKVENCGYEIARTWIHDALWTPAGILKVYWEPDLAPTSDYHRGLTDLQYGLLALAAEAGEIAIIKHKQYENPDFSPLTVLQHGLAMATGQAPAIAPQLQQGAQQGANALQLAQNTQLDPNDPKISEFLHDVVIYKDVDHTKNSRGQVKLQNIPLEEFYFDPLARNVQDSTYCAHARRISISDLRAMGFDADLLDEISNTQFDPEMSPTFLARTQLQGSYAYSYFNNNVDPSMREVIVVESYIKMDYMQTGVAEWRKIIHCGNTILLNEAVDGNPFILLVANPIPHTAFGISPAEQARNAQLNQTQLMRALIDNVSLGANSRMFAVDGEVNLDDLLDSRPGGIVRVKSPESVGVLQTTSGDVSSVTALIEVMDTMKQERTGVQKLTQGSDADIVNETATGYQAMTERSEQRIKLIARHFAETGFKPLALRIQKLLAQYQDEYMQIRVNGQLMEADPMDAANRYDVDVKVGLGTGDKSRELANLQQVLQLQQAALAQSTGMTNLNLVHNTVQKLVKAMGLNPEEYFCAPPAPMPQPPQPQVPPQDQVKLQIAQQSAQAEQQRQERQAQLDAMRIQAQAQSDNQQAQLAHEREMQKLVAQQQIEREKLYLQAAIQREQAALQAMVDPQEEAAMFNETFSSTTRTLNDALTGINLKASGDYDKFLQAVVDAPEPSTPDETGPQGQ
ncbi:hypothetical protein [Paraburkholderia sp. BR10882]|uniref:portal protein n=1 Tax=unclassified Paraburkholderia TaxID=2615204 RepID=UPI0034CEB1D1